MKRSTKIILTLSLLMLVGGLAMGLTGYRWGAHFGVYVDRSGSHVIVREPHSLVVNQPLSFERLEICAGRAQVALVPSDQFRLEAYYHDGRKPEYTLSEGVLTVTDSGTSDGGLRIMDVNFLNAAAPPNTLTVYLPREMRLESVSVVSGAGSVSLSELNAQSVSIACDFGDINLKGIHAQSLTLGLSSGSLNAESVTAGQVTCEGDFGNMRFCDLTAQSLACSLSSGDLRLEQAQLESADLQNDFGGIVLSGWHSGGLKIRLSSGQVRVEGTLEGETDIRADFADILVRTALTRDVYRTEFTQDFGAVIQQPENQPAARQDAPNALILHTGSGNIDVTFAA